MDILDEQTVAILKSELASLQKSVEVVFFRDSDEKCEYCSDTARMLDDVASASGKIRVTTRSLTADKEAAELYKVDKAPAIIVLDADGHDRGIRFFGVPGGHEFASFIEAVKMCSTGNSGLADQTKRSLAVLTTPTDIKIFVTLGCPYCPAAVKLAHKFAFENPRISAQMINAAEFRELTEKYSVYRVPKIIINDGDSSEGAPSEEKLLHMIINPRAPADNA